MMCKAAVIPLTIYLAMACIVASVRPAWAAWSDDPSINTPVVVAVNNQDAHRITHDGHGGYYVVWEDRGDVSPASAGIYAQYFSAAGDPQWGAEGTPVGDANGWQRDPLVVSDGVGGMVVSWRASGGVHAQRLDADGSRLWGDDGVLVVSEATINDGAVLISDGVGGAIVASFEGAANRVAADGTLPWAPADDPVWFLSLIHI